MLAFVSDICFSADCDNFFRLIPRTIAEGPQVFELFSGNGDLTTFVEAMNILRDDLKCIQPHPRIGYRPDKTLAILL